MKRLILYIILETACIYIALIYRNEAFLNIFYGSLLAFFVFLILDIINIHCLDISINIPETVVHAGKEIPVYIMLNNRGVLPTGRIGVYIKSINSYTGKKQVTKFYVSADGSASLSARCCYYAKNPGNIEFFIKKVWAEDYLGILKLPVFRYDKYEHPVIVIPKLYEVPVLVVHSIYENAGEDGNINNTLIAPDSMENGETRQYIPGDSFKNIHWKLSAKTGELMSKQKYSNVSCMAVFFIIPGIIGSAYKKKCFIQAVLSVSASLVLNGCIHYICWPVQNEDGLVRYIVKRESDAYCFIQEGINTVTRKNIPYKEILLIKDMYIRKYNEQINIPFIAINTEFELFADNRKIAQYDFKNLQNSIKTTEILI